MIEVKFWDDELQSWVWAATCRVREEAINFVMKNAPKNGRFRMDES
jgi:hypothetical protein